MATLVKKIYDTLLSEYGPQGWWPVNGTYFAEKEDIFEIIAGAVLTQNTAWKNAEKALQNLRNRGILNPEKISKLNTAELSRSIKASGYYNQKAVRLKTISTFFLHRAQKTDVPQREELLSLDGIGPETADSILLYAYHALVFVIDAYTRRVFRRIGCIGENDRYTDIQNIFMRALPPDEQLYNEYHALIVKHAKDICRKKPLCDECILGKKSFCSYAERDC